MSTNKMLIVINPKAGKWYTQLVSDEVDKMNEHTHDTIREVIELTRGQATSDGAGVKMVRLIGSGQIDMVDPFLLLDAFGTDKAEDYINGFPAHPHRGFETVTYMLAGRMRHKDSAGNEGVIAPNGVQWMTAGKGIIHSEMPEQEEGLMQGLQLWVNLPRDKKMAMPNYQEFAADKISVEERGDGVKIRVVAGKTNQGTYGVVNNKEVDPTYMDISLAPVSVFEQTLPTEHTALVYVVDGAVLVGEREQPMHAQTLAVLSPGEQVRIRTQDHRARIILIAGKPLHEPVARRGPFVMNTEQEIEKAYADYRSGQF